MYSSVQLSVVNHQATSLLSIVVVSHHGDTRSSKIAVCIRRARARHVRFPSQRMHLIRVVFEPQLTDDPKAPVDGSHLPLFQQHLHFPWPILCFPVLCMFSISSSLFPQFLRTQYQTRYMTAHTNGLSLNKQLDSYGAAQASQFNVARPRSTPRQSPGASWWGGFGSGGGGGGPGGPGPGSGGPRRRIGRVDDIRGPECRSCQ